MDAIDPAAHQEVRQLRLGAVAHVDSQQAVSLARSGFRCLWPAVDSLETSHQCRRIPCGGSADLHGQDGAGHSPWFADRPNSHDSGHANAEGNLAGSLAQVAISADIVIVLTNVEACA